MGDSVPECSAEGVYRRGPGGIVVALSVEGRPCRMMAGAAQGVWQAYGFSAVRRARGQCAAAGMAALNERGEQVGLAACEQLQRRIVDAEVAVAAQPAVGTRTEAVYEAGAGTGQHAGDGPRAQ